MRASLWRSKTFPVKSSSYILVQLANASIVQFSNPAISRFSNPAIPQHSRLFMFQCRNFKISKFPILPSRSRPNFASFKFQIIQVPILYLSSFSTIFISNALFSTFPACFIPFLCFQYFHLARSNLPVFQVSILSILQSSCIPVFHFSFFQPFNPPSPNLLFFESFNILIFQYLILPIFKPPISQLSNFSILQSCKCPGILVSSLSVDELSRCPIFPHRIPTTAALTCYICAKGNEYLDKWQFEKLILLERHICSAAGRSYYKPPYLKQRVVMEGLFKCNFLLNHYAVMFANC